MPVTQRQYVAPNRKIAFAAPETIHGALKQIVGWAEMNGVQVNGKPLTERDFLNSLIAAFWESDRKNWEQIIKANVSALETIGGSRIS